MGEAPICAFPVHGEWAYDENGWGVEIRYLCRSCEFIVRKRASARRSRERAVRRLNDLRAKNANLTATDNALARVCRGWSVQKWKTEKAIEEIARLRNELKEKINQLRG